MNVKMYLVKLLGADYQGMSFDGGERVSGGSVGRDPTGFEAVFTRTFFDRWCIMILVSAVDLLRQEWEREFGDIARKSPLAEAAYQAEDICSFGVVDIGPFRVFSHWKVWKI